MGCKYGADGCYLMRTHSKYLAHLLSLRGLPSGKTKFEKRQSDIGIVGATLEEKNRKESKKIVQVTTSSQAS
jgi:hypothetical protein